MSEFRGRTGLSIISRPGMEFDECFAAVIARNLDADLHFSGQKLACSLGLAISNVAQYLSEGSAEAANRSKKS